MWSNKQEERFRKALDKAFDEPSMELLLSDYFGRSFAGLSPPGFGKTSEFRIHEVIQQAKMEDWLWDLVAAAHERRPSNEVLATIAEDLGLTASGPRLINPAGTSLEAMINANAKFIKPSDFREKLAALEGQVCWVKVPGGGGTGFLIRPDLVLTNYHVIAPLLNGKASWADVVCQFDYKEAITGPVKNKKVTEVKLYSATEWLVDKRPPSSFDWDPALGDAAAHEADYAILRMNDDLGESPVGGSTLDTKAPKRGWVSVNGNAPALASGNLLFMLQHPRGEPLQLTVGSVKEFNKAGTRMRHDANSKNGSSGSPCLDADLQLVALHHAHDPDDPPKWNQAIPLGVIQKLWCKDAKLSALLEVQPCP